MSLKKIHTTAKGTELPILALKGKEYLEVKYRLVWFREERPTWGIETDFPILTDKTATCKAIIRDDTGRIVATSHKSEDTNGFPDFMEKSETGAIGRALALIGYGTQFCADELDEGERIVDSPAAVQQKATSRPAPLKAVSSPGDYQIGIGKFNGMTVKNIDTTEVKKDYAYWTNVANPGPKVKVHIQAIEQYLESIGEIDRPAAVTK